MNGSRSFISTSKGDHSPLEWALATADHLVHVSPNASAELQIAGRELELAIVKALRPHHEDVQTTENGRLEAHGDAHVTFHPDPTEHLNDAVAAVNACAKGTVFEEQWMQPEWQDQVRATLANHFQTSMKTAHSWHVDRNPHGSNAKAFASLRAAPPTHA